MMFFTNCFISFAADLKTSNCVQKKPASVFAHRLPSAGIAGFEPAIHGTKNRCLTTWPYPNDAMGAIGFEPMNPKEWIYSPPRLTRLR